MNRSVMLKGVKDGFTLTLDESASFESILNDTEALLEHLKMPKQEESGDRKDILLEVHSGNRLLNDNQKEWLSDLVHKKSSLKIGEFIANVLTYEESAAWQKEVGLQMKIQTIRSGQAVTASGDILLIGKVHPGGMIRASGNIFIIGELHGVAHAGFEGDTKAVIVADFQSKAQIRIADSVEIIDEKTGPEAQSEAAFAYINDLHILSFESLDQLKKVRPTIDIMSGGSVR